MIKLKTKDTLKKLLEKYQVYLHYMEMEAYFEKEKDAQINPDEITVARIIHYKADVLFSLVTEIVFHSTIHFDTFSAFFDFSFIESSFKNIELMDVKFNKAEFLKTLLKGVDFSSSDITDVMFDLISVKGMIVNQFQCVELVGLLGVCVK